MNLKDLIKKSVQKSAKRITHENYGFKTNPLTSDEFIRKVELALHIYKNATVKKEQDEAIMTLFQAVFAPKIRKGGGVFHPSEIASTKQVCLRKMYFQRSGIAPDQSYSHESEMNNGLLRLFDLGTMVHTYIQNSLWVDKILIEAEVRVSIPELFVEGHADAKILYQNEEMCLEVKTINTMQFGKLEKPLDPHIKQASIYAYGLGLKKILFLYYDKNNSALKEFVWDVDMEFVEYFKELVDKVDTLYRMNLKRYRTNDVAEHELFPREVCKKRTSDTATSCPFADSCFNCTK